MTDTPDAPESDDPLMRCMSARHQPRNLLLARSQQNAAGINATRIARGGENLQGQTAELGQMYPWVQVFENKGAAMGCSNPHPHGQVWANSFLPNEIEREDRLQRTYFAEQGSPMLVDYVQRELADGSRTVVETEHWLAVVPYWAAWPFETLLLPKAHILRITDLTAAQRDDLALALENPPVVTTTCSSAPSPTPWAGTVRRLMAKKIRTGNCTRTSTHRCCAPPPCVNLWLAMKCWQKLSAT